MPMPQENFEKSIKELQRKLRDLEEKFEDLVIEFAGLRRLVKERLEPEQIAKLEDLIGKSAKLESLLSSLPQRFVSEYFTTPEEQLRKRVGDLFPGGLPWEKIVAYDEKYTVRQLKQMCREKGLPTSRDKKELIALLIFHGYLP